ncbi:pirin family protein [Psychromonas sp.]|nr:pirin family protein [Psychromonas sp.]
MIKHYPLNQLGRADHGWLKSYFHFSFANYYNPDRISFGTLRVINDDWIAPNSGFPAHPHRNMEIISFIRSGAISHQDSEGNAGETSAGEVQVMSAGTGIKHSEFNMTNEPLTLYQIWIEPNEKNVTPRWETKILTNTEDNTVLPLLVSGYPEDKNNALYIHQFARIYGGPLTKGMQCTQKIEHQMYLLVSAGKIKVTDNKNVIVMHKGDGAEISQQKKIKIEVLENSDIILIDAPIK